MRVLGVAAALLETGRDDHTHTHTLTHKVKQCGHKKPRLRVRADGVRLGGEGVGVIAIAVFPPCLKPLELDEDQEHGLGTCAQAQVIPRIRP